MGFGLALGAFTLLATAASTYVAYQGQQYNAAVAKNTSEHNAKVEENAAIQADMEAREDAARTRAANRRFMSSQRASIAKSGITGAGSPLEVLGETAGQFELQAQDQARAARQRYALGMNQSQNTRIEGLAQSRGYQMQATGTLISGVAKGVSQYGSFKYNGNFSG